jgi:thiamine monophosphate synthase
MSSNLHVRRASELGEIPQVAVIGPASTEQLEEIWGALVHEVATVQAISAAAVEARTDESRVAYLKLLEAETAEMVALVQEVRPGFLGEAS